MSKKIFRNPFVYLSAEDGIILFRKKGVEVRYPSTTIDPDPNILSTMDYIRYAIERLDWQLEWHESILEEASAQRRAEEAAKEEASRPKFKVLTGGLDKSEKE